MAVDDIMNGDGMGDWNPSKGARNDLNRNS